MKESSFLSLVVVFVSILALIVMAESAGEAAKVHIIYTEKPEANEDAEAYHLRTLSSVLGSEEAAKDALVYSYSHAASGFSAKLTPEQATKISQLPGVIQVTPSQTYQLHTPGSGFKLT